MSADALLFAGEIVLVEKFVVGAVGGLLHKEALHFVFIQIHCADEAVCLVVELEMGAGFAHIHII